VIAIDIGGTKIASAVIEGGTELMLTNKIITPQQDGTAVVEAVIGQIEQARQQHQGQPIAAIGVSTGGQVGREGRILSATDTIPGWAGIDLRGALANRFGLPVAVLNDGHAATLAEAHFGAGRGYRSVLGLTIGTGLGGGLVIDGELQLGARGLAGSIGHIQIVPGGWRCSCGKRGCVEAYISGPALLKTYQERAELGESAETSEAVGKLALAGNQTAQSAVRIMGSWLGLGLANGLAALDADVVVIGGSVAQIGPLLFDSIRGSLQRYGFASTAHTPILPAAFGPQAGLIGAAALAWRRWHSDI
jgi:predicted NBD/HSP70 family sugar kinase